jgi:hypothetical protein
MAALQAAYYLPTAVVPFVSRRAFESVTGAKTEWWLVLTVSGLVGVIATALAGAARSEEPPPETRVLGLGAAGVFGAIDVVYVARRRISPVYLADAVLQGALALGWLGAEG